MLRKINIFLGTFLLCLAAWGETYQTRALVPDIATLRVQYDPDFVRATYYSRPVLRLGGDEVLDISFDQLSHEVHYYTYTLRHLDYDWSADDLSSQEYLSGFLTAEITDVGTSVTTQQPYTHYRFTFPNDDMRPTISGNYVLIIYEDNDPDKVVATACFSVVESGASIQAKVRGNTDIEYSGRYQQLDVDVLLNAPYSTMDARFSALVVEQNNRTDNMVVSTKPTYIEPQRLRWQNNRTLIFEGGNEYRHFDISSEYFMGQGVDHISFDHSVPPEALRPGLNEITFSSIAKPGAKRGIKHQLPVPYYVIIERIRQRQCAGCATGIRMFVHRYQNLVNRETQPRRTGFDNPDVCLVRNNPIDVILGDSRVFHNISRRVRH